MGDFCLIGDFSFYCEDVGFVDGEEVYDFAGVFYFDFLLTIIISRQTNTTKLPRPQHIIIVHQFILNTSAHGPLNSSRFELFRAQLVFDRCDCTFLFRGGGKLDATFSVFYFAEVF